MELGKLQNSTVEQLIDTIHSEKINKEKLIQKIDQSSLLDDIKNDLIYKINTAYMRINKPLEPSLKLFYLLFPFGIINIFSESTDSNFERFKRYKYLKKVKQFYIFSAIGFIAYILIGVIAGIYFRYYP